MKNRAKSTDKGRHSRYSVFGNVLYNMKSAKEWDRKLFYYQLLLVFPDVGAAYLGVLLPAGLVGALEQNWA